MLRRTSALFVLPLLFCTPAAAQSFHFVILGDRTGEAVPGVYREVWKEAAAENPAFIVSVGDTIQGLRDQTAAAQWQQIDRLLRPYRGFDLYLAPGNHDVWSALSARLFLQHARGLHYSFDYQDAHFTILDNSRSDQLSTEELDFLEQDLKAHSAQAWKFVIMHRPSWLADVALGNTNFRLHQIARHYGVQYVVAGHLHEMLHLELEGITYVSMASAGGHLRGSRAYQDGWFFGHALVTIDSRKLDFEIREAEPTHGMARRTELTDWGLLGLVKK